jgi:hypothetical protein
MEINRTEKGQNDGESEATAVRTDYQLEYFRAALGRVDASFFEGQSRR